MNKYKRKSKTKTLALGIGILSSAAVVSTGFAAWIIAGGDSVTGSGNIGADTVSSAEHTISKIEFTDADKIYFGAKEDNSITNPWLRNEKMAEKLSVQKTFTVDHLEANITGTEGTTEWYNSIFDVTSTKFIEKEDGSKETYSSVAEQKVKTTKSTSETADKTLVGELPKVTFGTTKNEAQAGVYINFVDFASTTTDTNKVGNFTVDIVFTWGTAFDSTNPYTYYNKQTKSKELSSEANSLLKIIEGISAQFELTIVTL